MTSVAVPQRRRRFPYRERPFDLRATAMFFGLSAVILVVLGLVARAALDVVERRPAWVVVLLLLGVAAALAWRRNRRRRRMSVARLARATTEALEEGAATALDVLDADAPATPAAPAERTRPVRVPAAGTVAVGPAGAETTAVAGDGALETTAVLGPTDLGLAGVDHTGADVGVDYAGVDYAGLDPYEFEQAIADLCVRDGCSRVEVVGGAGDLGADVVASTPDGRRLVIQCKRYGDDNKVGSQELQRFGGTCFTVHEADVAVVVTTSDFTAPAEEYAAQCGIVCVNHECLRAWSEGLAAGPWAALPVDGVG
ncbi:restriction endonuclease [Streptomyces sp. NPDC001595]|uniref:restriction endonuclease n=1 Tax=Streptomyces sp. NPDC001532 TaxID=3154520 RepID=UPI0033244BF9